MSNADDINDQILEILITSEAKWLDMARNENDPRETARNLHIVRTDGRLWVAATDGHRIHALSPTGFSGTLDRIAELQGPLPARDVIAEALGTYQANPPLFAAEDVRALCAGPRKRPGSKAAAWVFDPDLDSSQRTDPAHYVALRKARESHIALNPFYVYEATFPLGTKTLDEETFAIHANPESPLDPVVFEYGDATRFTRGTAALAAIMPLRL